jgi:spore coat polysaccharide biosynthesis predicted glycosyltransferase SpsG
MRFVFAAVVASVLLVPAAHAKSKADADAAEIENYKLSVPVLKKLEQVNENLYAAVKSNPSLANKYKDDKSSSDANESLEETAKKMDRIPELKAAISKAGLTTREYLIAGMALLQAAMASSISQMPGAETGHLSPGVKANMAFVKAHQAEINRMQERQKQLDRETKKASGDSAKDETPASDDDDQK